MSAIVSLADRPLVAQSAARPFAALLPASTVTFPHDTDSNSPAVWALQDGVWTLSLFNSMSGLASVSRGPDLRRLARAGKAAFGGAAPEGGIWFESVIRDADSWYGFYHNERVEPSCGATGKVWPRIGLARSDDMGTTWTDLGPILEAPAGTARCATRNRYFVGGVGDMSVMLDPDRLYAYLYFTQYIEADGRVGVSAARMAWADRDVPAGRVDVWNDGIWLPPSEAVTGETTWEYPLATPILPSPNRWDDARAGVDVLWGPSLHWNTAIEHYVMLLNKAVSDGWEQGGIYVAFNARLDAPDGWSTPTLLHRGGAWYPQVIGLDPTVGTDTLASGVARFFMAGRSDHTIVFGRR